MAHSDFVVVFCSTSNAQALSPSHLQLCTPSLSLLLPANYSHKDEKSVNSSSVNGTSIHKAKHVSEKAAFSHKQRFQDTRWFILITSIAVLLVTGIILALVKSNPIFLDTPTPLLLAMKPIIRSLFNRARKQRYNFK